MGAPVSIFAATRVGVTFVTQRPGEIVTPCCPTPVQAWWKASGRGLPESGNERQVSKI